MPVIISRTIAPACLPAASTDPDQLSDRDAAVMGWGPSSKWLIMEGRLKVLFHSKYVATFRSSQRRSKQRHHLQAGKSFDCAQ
jgi:hypothetical protein